MSIPIHGIIFDIGNTLMFLDGDIDHLAQQGAMQMTEFLASKGIDLEPAAVAHTFLAQRKADYRQASEIHEEQTCAHSLQLALDELGVAGSFAHLIPEAVRIYFEPEEVGWVAFPESRAVLKQLSGGYRMGVLSNATDDALIQRLVNRLGFRPWLAPVFTSAYLGVRKPRGEAFRAVLDTWRLPVQETVVVGDRLDADILGGHDLGMRTVLITADESADNELLRQTVIPDGVIAAIEELPALLDDWQT